MAIEIHDFIRRIEAEPENGETAFDEIVADKVNVHIERMNDGNYWMSISKPGEDDKRQIINFYVEKGKLIAITEKD